MPINYSVNDCGSVNGIDPALYLLNYFINNNYNGANGVSNVSITAYTSAGTNVKASSVSFTNGSSLSILAFAQNPWWDISVEFPLNCGSYPSCSINSITISGNWGSLGWALTFNTAPCNISGNNGSSAAVYIKASISDSNQIGINGNYCSITNNNLIIQQWWSEFWAEALILLMPSLNATVPTWNSGPPITNLGILVRDINGNVQYAYNVPSSVANVPNTGVIGMSIAGSGIKSLSNQYLYTMAINAQIQPKSFILGSLYAYMYFNLTPSLNYPTPIGLQGFAGGGFNVNYVQWGNAFNYIQYTEEVTMPTST